MYETPYHTEDLGQYSFLVTGGAGFIGSNLVEYLRQYGAKKVRVLDNFSTGSHQNIEEFKVNPTFDLIEGDIRDLEISKRTEARRVGTGCASTCSSRWSPDN